MRISPLGKIEGRKITQFSNTGQLFIYKSILYKRETILFILFVIITNLTNNTKTEKADLKKIGWDSARGVDSYFLEKDRYIAVLNKLEGEYNIYDISNDNWMINKNIKLNVDIDGSARSLLVCNKLFVLSCYRNIYIYSICNDICNPQLIQTYKIKDKTKDYRFHGMCLFECNELKDGKSIHFKILLFGGLYNHSFLKSFLELCIKLELNYENIYNSEFEISEKARKQVKCVNFDPQSKDCNIENGYYDFGFECFLNSKNEPIIIIIGGYTGDYLDERVCYSLFEYNIVYNELFLYGKVKCFVLDTLFCCGFYSHVYIFAMCLHLICLVFFFACITYINTLKIETSI